MRQSSPIDVVEAAYGAAASGDAWLRGVLEAAAPQLHPGVIPSGYFVDFSGARARPVHGVQCVGGPASMAESVAAFHNAAPALSRALHEHWSRGAATATQLVRAIGYAPEFEQFLGQLVGTGLRIADALGVAGLDASRRGVVLSCVYDRQTALTRSLRLRWTRVAAHLAAGFRLRSALEASPSGSAPQPDAVLTPAGRIEHAEGEAKPRAARESLRLHAAGIDRARGRLRRSDPDAALEAWQGLVAGRWSLVDRFESDGRRYIVAHRNEPSMARVLSLTPRERQVVGYRMLGHSSKLTSYALGISPAAVSVALKSSVQKLGVGTVARMLHDLSDVAMNGVVGGREDGDEKVT